MHISVNSGTRNSRNATAKHLEHYEHSVTVTKDVMSYVRGSISLYDKVKGASLEEHELLWFTDRFTPMYDAQCKKNKARGQEKRNKPIEEYMQGKIDKHIRESIFQVGSMLENIGNEHMQAIYRAFTEKREAYNQEHNLTFKVIDAVLHTDEDEATPHIHERGVFIAKDDMGNDIPEMDKALEQAGIPILDPSNPPKNRKEARYNNRTITYTNEMRELFLTTAREYMAENGLNCSLEDIHYTDSEAKDKVRHKSVKEYTMEQIKKTAETLELANQKLATAEQMLDLAGEKRKMERLEKLEKMKADREKQEVHDRFFGGN